MTDLLSFTGLSRLPIREQPCSLISDSGNSHAHDWCRGDSREGRGLWSEDDLVSEEGWGWLIGDGTIQFFVGSHDLREHTINLPSSSYCKREGALSVSWCRCTSGEVLNSRRSTHISPPTRYPPSSRTHQTVTVTITTGRLRVERTTPSPATTVEQGPW